MIEARRYPFPSFDTYFELSSMAGRDRAEYAALPEEVRRTVREEVRRGLEGEWEGAAQSRCQWSSCSAAGAGSRPVPYNRSTSRFRSRW